MNDYRRTYLSLKTLQVLTDVKEKPSASQLQKMLLTINVRSSIKECTTILSYLSHRFTSIQATQKELPHVPH